GGIRVPMMLSWTDKLPKDRAYDYRASPLDLVPSCFEAAGIDPSGGAFAGPSLLEAGRAERPASPSPNPLYCTFEKHSAIIDGEWKLVFTEDYNPENRPITSQIQLGNSNNQLGLYHLASDPGERKNRVQEEPEKVKALTSRFKAWMDKMQ